MTASRPVAHAADLEGAHYDVVVIGGGFAGVTAARDLTDRGNNVLLLEAHERLGGRAASGVFPGSDIRIALGGQYIDVASHRRLAREIARYGVEVKQHPQAQSIHTHIAGGRHRGPLPLPAEQLVDLERAVVQMIRSAARIELGTPLDQQDVADLDIPFAEFLAPLKLPSETYELVTAHHALFTFRYPEEVSALQVLLMLASWDLRVYRPLAAVHTHIDAGGLVERMVADAGGVRIGCQALRVEQSDDTVLVTTSAGDIVTASLVVMAVPGNVWNDIEFAPALSEAKRVAADERPGTERIGKVWVRVRDAPPRPAVVAAPQSTDGLVGLFTEDEFEGGDQLMGIFGALSLAGDDYELSFQRRDHVERALAALVPGAELVSFCSHDWEADPFAKGGSVSWRPGRLTRSHSQLVAPEGRIAFATADISCGWSASIEGAIESGEQAARYAQDRLAREREAAPGERPVKL